MNISSINKCLTEFIINKFDNLETDNEKYNFGYLVYFYMLSCAVSAYMLGVNPFNQNGVEEYKKNMKMFLNN